MFDIDLSLALSTPRSSRDLDSQRESSRDLKRTPSNSLNTECLLKRCSEKMFGKDSSYLKY
jgi:hypothetical protein